MSKCMKSNFLRNWFSGCSIWLVWWLYCTIFIHLKVHSKLEEKLIPIQCKWRTFMGVVFSLESPTLSWGYLPCQLSNNKWWLAYLLLCGSKYIYYIPTIRNKSLLARSKVGYGSSKFVPMNEIKTNIKYQLLLFIAWIKQLWWSIEVQEQSYVRLTLLVETMFVKKEFDMFFWH